MALTVEEVEAVLRLRDEMTAKLQTATRGLDAFASTARTVGTSLTAALTLPLIAVAGASLKFSTDFESATTKLGTLSDVGAQQVSRMREEILALAPAVAIGPNELARALLVVTSTGLRGAEAMDVLEGAARASAIGLGAAADIARAVTAAVNAYGVTNLDAARATDILVQSVVEGGAEATEFASTIGRVVAIAAEMGVSFEETGAFIATFTRLGVGAEEAVTALRGTMIEILNPSKQSEEAIQQLGMTFDDLRASIRERGLTASLIDLVERAGAVNVPMVDIISNSRALTGVLATAGSQGEQFSAVLANIQRSSEGGGVTLRKFGEASATTAHAMAELRARVEVAAVQFGNALAPSLARVLEALLPVLRGVEHAVKAFADLPRPVQTTAIVFGALAAALGPLLFVVGQMVIGFGSLAKLAAMAAGPVGQVGVTAGAASGSLLAARTSVQVLGSSFAGLTSAATGAVRGLMALLPGGLPAVLVGVAGGIAFAILGDQWQKTLRQMESDWERLRAATDPSAARQLGIARILDRETREVTQKAVALEAELAKLPPLVEGTSAKIATIGMAPLGMIAVQVARALSDGHAQAVTSLASIHATVGQQTAKSVNVVDEAIAKLRGALAALTPQQQSQITTLMGLGQSTEQVAKTMHLSADIVDAYAKRTRAMVESSREAAKAQEELTTTMRGTTIFRDAAIHAMSYLENLRLTKSEQAAFNSAFEAAAEKARALGPAYAGLASTYGTLAAQTRTALEVTRPLHGTYLTIAEVIPNVVAAQFDLSNSFGILRGDMQAASLAAIEHAAGNREVMNSLNGMAAASQEASDRAAVAALNYSGSLRNLSQSLANLSQITGGALDGFARIVGAMAAGREASLTFAEGIHGTAAALRLFNAEGGQTSHNFSAIVAGVAQVAASIPGMIAAMNAATSSSNRLQNALGGATTGMQIGMTAGLAFGASFGPWGAAIGAAAGALFGFLRGIPEHAKVAQEALRDFGATISEKLAREIADAAKQIGDRWTATMLHLADVVREAGGVTVENFARIAVATHDLFSGLERGQLTINQVNKQFGILAPQLATVALNANASQAAFDAFIELIQVAVAHGADVSAVTQAVTQLATTTVKTLQEATAAGGLLSAEMVRSLQSTQAAGIAAGEIGALFAAQTRTILGGLQAAATNALALTTTSAEAMAGTLIAAFQAARAQGLSLGETIKLIEPALTSLANRFKEDVLKVGGGAFQQIRDLVALASNELVQKGVAAVAGFGDALRGMNNLGLLNQQTFQGLTSGIYETFRALELEGLGGQQVMQLMQRDLQTTWELTTRHGFVVDENTQKLLDEAYAAGIVGEAFESEGQRQINALMLVVQRLDLLLKALGVEVPNALGVMATVTETQSDRAGQAVRGHLGGALEAVTLESIPSLMSATEAATFEMEGDIGNVTGAAWDLEFALGPSGVVGTFGAAAGAAVNFAAVAVPAIEDVSSAVNALNFGSSPGGLTGMIELLYQVANAAGISQAALTGFASAVIAQVAAANATLAELLANMANFAKTPARPGTITSGPLAGYPTMPKLLTEEEAIARINEVFQFYLGRNATMAELAMMAATYGYGGTGKIAAPKLEDFLKQLATGYIQTQLVGLQRGGIVRKPTLALVGERGPERVEPLSADDDILAELRAIRQLLRTLPSTVASAAVLAQR